MALEVFYAYWDPSATPLLGELLDAAPIVSSAAALPASLELYLRPQAQVVPPALVMQRREGVVARLYGPSEALAAEAESFLGQGHAVVSLPTLGPCGPKVQPPPYAGRRVLVTRAAAQAGALLGALRLRGAEPVLLAALSIEPAVDASPLEVALERLGTYRYMLFTSQNAVQNFFAALDAKAMDVRRLGDARLLAVGPATALSLRARGLLAEIAREGTASGLAAQLAGRVRPGDRALLLGPDPVDQALLAALGELGLRSDAVPLYRTVRQADKVQAAALVNTGPPDAAVFYSPSAVQGAVSALPRGFLNGVPTVAIGPTTRAACLELGLAPAAQAASPGLAAILAALRQVLPGPKGSSEGVTCT